MIRFTILGALTAMNGEREFTPRTPKVCQVLALLLSRANRIVGFESLIEELWGEDPPKTAQSTAQTYIYQLRKVLERERLATPAGELLVTKPFGYVLQVDGDQLDAYAFQRMLAEGRKALAEGRYLEASRQLGRALDLWTGPPLANVSQGSLLRAYGVHREEERLRAVELRIQADVLLGRHRELVGELKALAATYPHNEWFHAQLISALCRSGRRSEALHAYRNVRSILNQDLGIDPSRELQDLHQAILTTGLDTGPELQFAG
ncbi:AfsR/SARP family transcriptional regulator [Nonomuraea sp. 10N515B]|uniref:AfsR/SARP family transcriptional regulator n=1 Tax=Nonomuraea sp. 10N515B TaxID=3457422 RepID=UPI003FCD7B6A